MDVKGSDKCCSKPHESACKTAATDKAQDKK